MAPCGRGRSETRPARVLIVCVRASASSQALDSDELDFGATGSGRLPVGGQEVCHVILMTHGREPSEDISQKSLRILAVALAGFTQGADDSGSFACAGMPDKPRRKGRRNHRTIPDQSLVSSGDVEVFVVALLHRRCSFSTKRPSCLHNPSPTGLPDWSRLWMPATADPSIGLTPIKLGLVSPTYSPSIATIRSSVRVRHKSHFGLDANIVETRSLAKQTAETRRRL